jgi:hypothetical protein
LVKKTAFPENILEGLFFMLIAAILFAIRILFKRYLDRKKKAAALNQQYETSLAFTQPQQKNETIKVSSQLVDKRVSERSHSEILFKMMEFFTQNRRPLANDLGHHRTSSCPVDLLFRFGSDKLSC